jgi:putative flippase GtrA
VSDTVPMTREVVLYALVGGLVIGTDWSAFVLLSWLGVPLWLANVTARVAGALLGYLVNANHTFRDGKLPTHQQLVRFAIMWVLLTALSTLAVEQLGMRAAWIGKPVIDGVLAVVGFLSSKYWIYR